MCKGVGAGGNCWWLSRTIVRVLEGTVPTGGYRSKGQAKKRC